MDLCDRNTVRIGIRDGMHGAPEETGRLSNINKYQLSLIDPRDKLLL